MVHNKKYIPKDMERVDVIIYGHSHKYEEKYLGERLLLNPGSCGPRRFTQPITFAILEITGDHSFHVEKIEIAHEGKVAGVKGRGKGVPEEAGHELTGRDMKKAVRAVMRDTDKKLSIPEIAARNGISEELAEQICRLYLTHPGVSAEESWAKWDCSGNDEIERLIFQGWNQKYRTQKIHTIISTHC